MRAKKAFFNTVTSLIAQLVSVICGFIVPIAYINAFGSETYGAIGAITQYLGFIALLEAGVGGVTRAALYKPIADDDIVSISSIVKATERFFRGVGGIFIVYSLIVAFVFPYISRYSGDSLTAAGLTFAISAGTLAQYMFGLTYSLLLQADQRAYITNIFHIVASIGNAAIVIVTIQLGLNVVQVMWSAAILFVLRPLILGLYVRKRYSIVKDAVPDKAAIKDRWNGLGHHLAFHLRSNVAVVALSVFAPLEEIAVFTVYNLVASGLQRVVSAFCQGSEAAFGSMIARNEREALASNFKIMEIISSVITAIAFSTAIATILPFIQIYTYGVEDADYYRPLFAVILLFATAVYCFRLPYNFVVLAAGHYRQTRNGAFAEAGICVGLSILLVVPFGVVGVALALLIATVFRTLQYGIYASRVILQRKLALFAKQVLFLILLLGVCSLSGLAIVSLFSCSNYFDWCLLTLAVLAESSAIVIVTAWLLNREDFLRVFRKLAGVFRR